MRQVGWGELARLLALLVAITLLVLLVRRFYPEGVQEKKPQGRFGMFFSQSHTVIDSVTWNEFEVVSDG